MPMPIEVINGERKSKIRLIRIKLIVPILKYFIFNRENIHRQKTHQQLQ